MRVAVCMPTYMYTYTYYESSWRLSNDTRQVTLKDLGLCGYVMLERFIGYVCRTLSWMIVSVRLWLV